MRACVRGVRNDARLRVDVRNVYTLLTNVSTSHRTAHPSFPAELRITVRPFALTSRVSRRSIAQGVVYAKNILEMDTDSRDAKEYAC